MLDASLALLLGTNNAPSSRSKVRHTHGHTTESPQRVHRGLKRKHSKRAAGPRHGLVDVAGAPLLAVEADLLRRVLLLHTARRSADVGHRLGWRLVRCRRGGRGRGSRRGGSLRIALGLALARNNLPPVERAARHRVVVVGKGARERVSRLAQPHPQLCLSRPQPLLWLPQSHLGPQSHLRSQHRLCEPQRYMSASTSVRSPASAVPGKPWHRGPVPVTVTPRRAGSALSSGSVEHHLCRGMR